jgi:hypothetical protein
LRNKQSRFNTKNTQHFRGISRVISPCNEGKPKYINMELVALGNTKIFIDYAQIPPWTLRSIDYNRWSDEAT